MAEYQLPNDLDVGEHILTVEATANGLTTSTDIPFTINEKLAEPIAEIVYDETKLFKNNIVRFDGSSSYQTDGSIVKYEWSNGATTPYIDLKLTEDTEITLKVTSEDSQTKTITKQITLFTNDTVLGENEVLRQSEKYASYFVDSQGTFEVDGTFEDSLLVVPKTSSFVLELRNQDRFIRGIDNLNFDLELGDLSVSYSSSKTQEFAKIYLQNGNYITLRYYYFAYSSPTRSVYVNFNGYRTHTVYVDSSLKVNLNFHFKGNSLVVNGSKHDISSYANGNIGGIVKFEFYSSGFINLNKISNLVLSEIEAEDPIVTLSSDNKDAVEFDTPCVLTANADQFVTYLWDNGETTQSINIAPRKTTEYSCTVTNDSGKQSIAYITQSVIPYEPIAVISSNRLSNNVLKVSENDFVVILSKSYSPKNLPFTQKWYLNDELISTDKSIKLKGKQGTVKLVVEDEMQNVSEASITLTLTDDPIIRLVDYDLMTKYDSALKTHIHTVILPIGTDEDLNNMFK